MFEVRFWPFSAVCSWLRLALGCQVRFLEYLLEAVYVFQPNIIALIANTILVVGLVRLVGPLVGVVGRPICLLFSWVVFDGGGDGGGGGSDVGSGGGNGNDGDGDGGGGSGSGSGRGGSDGGGVRWWRWK